MNFFSSFLNFLKNNKNPKIVFSTTWSIKKISKIIDRRIKEFSIESYLDYLRNLKVDYMSLFVSKTKKKFFAIRLTKKVKLVLLNKIINMNLKKKINIPISTNFRYELNSLLTSDIKQFKEESVTFLRNNDEKYHVLLQNQRSLINIKFHVQFKIIRFLKKIKKRS